MVRRFSKSLGLNLFPQATLILHRSCYRSKVNNRYLRHPESKFIVANRGGNYFCEKNRWISTSYWHTIFAIVSSAIPHLCKSNFQQNPLFQASLEISFANASKNHHKLEVTFSIQLINGNSSWSFTSHSLTIHASCSVTHQSRTPHKKKSHNTNVLSFTLILWDVGCLRC